MSTTAPSTCSPSTWCPTSSDILTVTDREVPVGADVVISADRAFGSRGLHRSAFTVDAAAPLGVAPTSSRVERVTASADGTLAYADAMGSHSDGLNLSFVRLADGSLGLCCPGGRVVGAYDNPYSLLRQEAWLRESESRRADEATSRADAAARRAEEAIRRAEALEAELEALRRQRDG